MISMLWPIVSKHIEMALEHANGEIDINKMKTQLETGELIMLTANRDNEIIASIVIDKRRLQCGDNIIFVVTIGGKDMMEWGPELLPVLEEIAKEQDCVAIYGAGRSGWERVMKNDGYEAVHTVYCKRLGE